MLIVIKEKLTSEKEFPINNSAFWGQFSAIRPLVQSGHILERQGMHAAGTKKSISKMKPP